MATPAPLRPIARRALATQSDDRLVKLLREGHEPAFEEMVRRYRGPLIGFAAAIVSADGAEDVVQASLERAHRALLVDGREIALRPWLFAIVRNGALNAIRGEPPVDELGDQAASSAGPSEIAEQHDDLDRLVVAMCALPAAQREALVKRELEGVGHGEIAAQLGTTATAVRGLIFRARTGLRDALGAAVPIPLVRMLMDEGSALGFAGGGAGAGTAALLGGGTAVKGGGAVAAVVVALGTGIAIDQGRDGQPVRGDDGATEVSREAPSGTAEPSGTADSAGTTGSEAGPSSNGSTAGSDRSSSGGEGGGSGSAGDGGVDDASGPIGGGDPRPAEPGGGSDDEPGDDSSGPGPGADDGGNSGPGSGADPDDNSGPGGPEEPDEPTEPPEPAEPDDDDSSNSGPGGGGESGSGSSGSGSGSDDGDDD